jgi:hypothetical protein
VFSAQCQHIFAEMKILGASVRVVNEDYNIHLREQGK